jgi:hypothetical protein
VTSYPKHLIEVDLPIKEISAPPAWTKWPHRRVAFCQTTESVTTAKPKDGLYRTVRICGWMSARLYVELAVRGSAQEQPAAQALFFPHSSQRPLRRHLTISGR